MKRLYQLSILLLALLTPATATAYDFEVDGIYYNINGSNATVTNYNNTYSGDVVIPETVTYNGTTYLVTSIGYGAFYNCSGLTSVTIPNSVTSIGYSAFYNCSGLTNVTIPNSVTEIGPSAFERCRYMKSISIPSSVVSIGTYAFGECSSLLRVIIPNSVTTIGAYAFSDCHSLNFLDIPISVTSIGEKAFFKCYALQELQFNARNCSIGSKAFHYTYSGSGGYTYPLIMNRFRIGEFVEHIPNGLPQFSLSSTLVLPNSVKTIDSNSLIGSCAAVVIGDNIDSIAAGAFSSAISVAYVSSTTPLPCSAGAFYNPQTLYVPQGCRGKYLMSDGWCEFANIVEGSYIPATELTLDVDSAMLHRNETLQLNAMILPEDVSTNTPTWRSTNSAVASINATGLVSAMALGEADIWCSVDNKTAICHITVVGNIVDSVQLNYTDLLLDWDNIVDLTAAIYPESVDQSVTWTIPENDNIYARVVGNKLRVMAMRSGSVTVTATSVADSSVSADCVITIQIPDVNGDTSLNISDVTALIDYLLGGDPESINIGDADVDRDGNVNIADVTALIDKLLSEN